MIVLEEKAHTKRCCGPEGSGYVDGEGIRSCIGSACMAWHFTKGIWVLSRGQFWRKGEPSPDLMDTEERATPWGYCGLAPPKD